MARQRPRSWFPWSWFTLPTPVSELNWHRTDYCCSFLNTWITSSEHTLNAQIMSSIHTLWLITLTLLQLATLYLFSVVSTFLISFFISCCFVYLKYYLYLPALSAVKPTFPIWDEWSFSSYLKPTLGGYRLEGLGQLQRVEPGVHSGHY